MAARFAESTEAEIAAFLKKATPENTKKQINMEYIIKQLFHSLSSLIANSNKLVESIRFKVLDTLVERHIRKTSQPRVTLLLSSDSYGSPGRGQQL